MPEKRGKKHSLTLATGMILDEPINAREFYANSGERFEPMESWTVGMYHLALEFAEAFDKSTGRKIGVSAGKEPTER